MLKHSPLHRKPDPLKLLVILVALGVLMTSAVDAAEPFYRTPTLTDLEDGDVMLAPMGKEGAGVHMWYKSSPVSYSGKNRAAVSTDPIVSTPSVFLFVRVPW